MLGVLPNIIKISVNGYKLGEQKILKCYSEK